MLRPGGRARRCRARTEILALQRQARGRRESALDCRSETGHPDGHLNRDSVTEDDDAAHRFHPRTDPARRRRDGPTFLLTAGIHAAEYTGVDAAIRLGHLIEPDQVRGRIVIIPMLNQPGFYERSIYVNPEDNDNINRVFPGRPDGTWSERFAHHLLTEVIQRSDYAIDLHAGDMIEDLEPFVIYRETGDAELDEKARRMINAYGAELVVKAMPTGER